MARKILPRVTRKILPCVTNNVDHTLISPDSSTLFWYAWDIHIPPTQRRRCTNIRPNGIPDFELPIPSRFIFNLRSGPIPTSTFIVRSNFPHVLIHCSLGTCQLRQLPQFSHVCQPAGVKALHERAQTWYSRRNEWAADEDLLPDDWIGNSKGPVRMVSVQKFKGGVKEGKGYGSNSVWWWR